MTAAGTAGTAARPVLRATVGPLAAAVIARELGSQLERMAAHWAACGSDQVAQQLREALAEMRESARLRNTAQAGPRGVSGTAEVPQTSDVARSERLHGADGMLSVEQVATRVGLSDRRVRTLCEDGQLVATKATTRGRPYLIDPVSVEVFLDERSST